jgi:hypothetical protein
MDRRTVLKSMALAGAAELVGCGGAPGPITRVPSWVELEHPEVEADLVELVRLARERKAQLRVRGSMHSVGRAIFTDEDDRNINVQLDRYNQILCWDEERMRVTVQAGIHLGRDPLDSSTSWLNSLNLQLQQRGWALPTLGGITHQTVGGFLSTGSAGGTVKHDMGSSIVSMRIVAGDGKAYTLAPNPADPNDEDNNPFFAAGVSMGLFGIISEVTFQCVPSYNIFGKVVTCGVGDPHAPCNVYADGKRGLAQWFEDQEHNRALFWPQRGIEKVEFWQGHSRLADPLFRPEPFVELEKPLQKIASAIYQHVDKKPPPYDDDTYQSMRSAISMFITDNHTKFSDYWYRALPTDNAISDLWMPTEFTELFIDIAQTGPLLRALRKYWQGDRRMERTGPYSTEIYPSKESRFWLSPSFRRRSVRVDWLWFKSGHTNPAKDFYPQYWTFLRPYNFRFHWGKHLSAPESSTGVAYRKAQVGEARWNQWMQFRHQFDPDRIFVTDYWRKHLGIT